MAYFWFSSEFLIISYGFKVCGKKLKEFGENARIWPKTLNEPVAGRYTQLPKKWSKIQPGLWSRSFFFLPETTIFVLVISAAQHFESYCLVHWCRGLIFPSSCFFVHTDFQNFRVKNKFITTIFARVIIDAPQKHPKIPPRSAEILFVFIKEDYSQVLNIISVTYIWFP